MIMGFGIAGIVGIACYVTGFVLVIFGIFMMAKINQLELVVRESKQQ